MNVMSRLMSLCVAAFLTLASFSVVSGYPDESARARGGEGRPRTAPSLQRDITFRVTDQLSAQTQAAVFPRHGVAFSLTHRVWADAPEEEGEAARHELGRLRLSQQFNPPGQQEHAFGRLEPAPLWATLLLEARAAPISRLQLSTTAAYNPAGAHLAWAAAELKVQPLSFWSLSLAHESAEGLQLGRLTGRMQLTLPGAWTISYAVSSPTLDGPLANQTVTTRYRSSYGTVRLRLAQSSEERCVGVLLDLATLLHRTLGF
jgi:hypothetical protein